MGISTGAIDVSFKNNWNKPIHRWYRFHAGCSSEFPEKIINLLKIKKESTILDPFVGSGTILVSAKEKGINSIGLDLNPFYVFVAKVKTCWEFDMKHLSDAVHSLEKHLERSKEETSGNFRKKSSEVNNIPKYIARYFDLEVLEELSLLKEYVFGIEAGNIRDMLLFALASILMDVSKVHYVGETIVFDKTAKTNNVSVHKTYIQKVLEMYKDLKTKQHISDRVSVEVKKEDARNLGNMIPDGSINHVITHPPYLNNYNYLLRDRLPLFFLEYFKTLSDENKMRDLIIGSVSNNRVYEKLASDIPEVEEIAEKVKSTGDMERCNAVLAYFDSMDLILEKLHNKLKENGYCAMLVGNSYVRGIMIPLDTIIVRIAEKNGFKLISNSVVRDRGNGAFQHLYNGKLYESIVILKCS